MARLSQIGRLIATAMIAVAGLFALPAELRAETLVIRNDTNIPIVIQTAIVVNNTVKVDRPVEAEVIVPDSDDDDDRPEDKPEQPAAPPKQEPAAAPPVEDVQLKKAIEILKQTPAPKGQEQKHTAHAPKQSQGASAYEERYDG